MNRQGYKLIILGGLILSLINTYLLPRSRYQSKSITKQILDSIPLSLTDWKGKAIDSKINIDSQIYTFLHDIKAIHYASRKGNLLFIVLDAGNFHYPKVCFRGIGFKTEELPARELTINGHKIKIHIMHSFKPSLECYSFYWICIDKKVVPTWIEQKIKQLFYSLFNKKKVGLMMRIDICNCNLEKSLAIAKDFLIDLQQHIPSVFKEYIFGENSQIKSALHK